MSRRSSSKLRKKQTRERKSQYIQNYKILKKCKACMSPDNLTFHHRNRDRKDFAIGNVGSKKSWDHLVWEISKCDVLCRDCHDKIHGFVKAKQSMSIREVFSHIFSYRLRIVRV